MELNEIWITSRQQNVQVEIEDQGQVSTTWRSDVTTYEEGQWWLEVTSYKYPVSAMVKLPIINMTETKTTSMHGDDQSVSQNIYG